MATRSFWERNLVNTGILAAMAVVLVIAGYASWKQYERHARIKAEVAILETEKERIKKENESLKERISYFATENFQEQESKARLNMRNDNEYVVDIERVPNAMPVTPKNTNSALSENANIPNYKKWWEKIF